jgi:hypothetical protein
MVFPQQSIIITWRLAATADRPKIVADTSTVVRLSEQQPGVVRRYEATAR